MKLKQILFLALISNQALIYPVSTPVPSFDNISEVQTAMKLYANSIMTGEFGAPYLLSKEVLPKWSSARPADWQAAEMDFLNNHFTIGTTGEMTEGDISSADLVNYLESMKSNYGSSFNIDTALTNLNNKVASIDPADVPEGFLNPLEYVVVGKIPSFSPIPNIPNVPDVGPTGGNPTTGTGNQPGENIPGAQEYYTLTEATASNLQQLITQNQLTKTEFNQLLANQEANLAKLQEAGAASAEEIAEMQNEINISKQVAADPETKFAPETVDPVDA